MSDDDIEHAARELDTKLRQLRVLRPMPEQITAAIIAALKKVHDDATAAERERCAAIAHDGVCGCGSNTAHLIAIQDEMPEYSAKVLAKYRARGEVKR